MPAQMLVASSQLISSAADFSSQRAKRQLKIAEEKLVRAQRHAEDRRIKSEEEIQRFKREYEEMSEERRENDRQVEETKQEANEVDRKVRELFECVAALLIR